MVNGVLNYKNEISEFLLWNGTWEGISTVDLVKGSQSELGGSITTN